MAGGFNRLCSIYFTVLEPVFALGGTYLTWVSPLKFIQSTLVASHRTLSTVEEALLVQLGAEYLLFAFCGALVLRFSRDKNLWRIVITACALSDMGHLYGVSILSGLDRLWMFWLWSQDEWINNGMLWFGLMLRVGWLALN